MLDNPPMGECKAIGIKDNGTTVSSAVWTEASAPG